MPKLVYYITAHGYGHAVRSVAICNKINPNIKTIFRTGIPREFFTEEMNRNFEYTKKVFDCGTVQIDTLNVDVKKTADLLVKKIKQNNKILNAEVKFLRENGVDLVISDIVPFAFKVADIAGIPSIAIGNFTWIDIYKPFVKYDPRYREIISVLSSEYSLANYILRLEPSNKMEPYEQVGSISIPPISRDGENRRKEINRMFDIDPEKKLCVVYLGHYGLENVNWTNLQNIENWEFTGVLPISPSLLNYHIVDKTKISYSDIIASADAVLGKIGYGTFSESVHNSIPLLYVPRNNFAEHKILENELKKYKLAYPLPQDKFQSMNIADTLESATTTTIINSVKNGSIKLANFLDFFFQ